MTQIFIVSGTSWTVPTDWNSANNTVETIGAGGGGQTANASYAGSGGGGGAYSKITNLSLAAGSSITIQVGTGGSAGIAGGDTWFNGASLAASSVGAKGGGGGGDGSGGAGGAASSGVGTTKYNGGNGGTDTANPYGAAGGGGAAGPNGPGSAGVGSDLTTMFGGCGGGGNGGGSSTGGSVGSDGFGGNGGAAEDGTAGGTGGSGSGAAGGAGSHGSGGGGGGGGSGNGANGGNGGNYGGGGGGGGYSGPAKGAGGNGAQGLIIVTYTPTASAAVTAESWSALEVQETARADQSATIEFGLTAPCDSRSQSEAGGSVWRSNAAGIDFASLGAGDLRFSAEWAAGAITTTADTLARLEAGARSSADASAPLEPASRAIREVAALSEWNAIDAVQTWPAVEQLATVGGDCAPPFECERLLTLEAQACQECTNPLDTLLVSSERLLRPPARVRILASPGSLHPLRGQ